MNIDELAQSIEQRHGIDADTVHDALVEFIGALNGLFDHGINPDDIGSFDQEFLEGGVLAARRAGEI